ncbi:MAG: C39 family peptidase, partial [Candidatus Eisenbacteria bacterium]
SENSCGTTGLAMIYQYLTGQPISQREIDEQIRRVNGFGTAPTDLVEFARSKGLTAEMYNNASINDIKHHLSLGRAVQVSLDDPYDKGKNFGVNYKDHYVIVTGFVTIDGKEYVKVRDPNGDDNSNANKWVKGGNGDYLMPRDVFEQKWRRTGDGYNNFMIVYGKPGDRLPKGNIDGAEHSVNLGENWWNLANNFDRVTSPRDAGDFAHGVIGGLGAAFGFTLTGPGWALSALGREIDDWGKGLPRIFRGPVRLFGNLMAAPGLWMSSIGAGISGAFNHFGKAADSLFHGKVGDAVEEAGKGVVRAAEGVIDGAASAAKSVWKGITSIF